MIRLRLAASVAVVALTCSLPALAADDSKALADAIKAGDHAGAAAAVTRIDTATGALPAWVGQKQQAASAVPEDKQRILAIWSRARQKVEIFTNAGDAAKAVEAAQQAWQIARDNLGDGHMAAIASAAGLAQAQAAAGDVEGAQTTLDEAVRSATKSLGAGHPQTLAILDMKADLLSAQGQYDKAAAIYAAAAKAAAKDLGARHPLALAEERKRARALADGGHPAEAEKATRDACGQLRKTLGDGHPQTSRCLVDLAGLVRQRGDLPAAGALVDEAARALGVTLEPADRAMLTARREAASIAFKREGGQAEAQSMLEALVKDAEAAGQADIAQAARGDLADVLDERGDYVAAESIATQLYDQQVKTLGEAHPQTLATLTTLASLARKQGRLREAEEKFDLAYQRFRKVLGDSHTSTIAAANNLGEILEKEGLFDKAEPLLRDAVAQATKSFGPENPSTLVSMNNLALLHESQGEFDKAEALYKTVISLYGKKLGTRHPETMAFVNNLAYLYMLKRDYADAATSFQQVVDTLTKVYGPDHQNTLKALNNLGRAKLGQGQVDDAEKLIARALDRRRAVLGARHLDTLRSMHDLAAVERAAKRPEKALALLEETRKADEEVLGTLHPYTFETLNSQAAVLEDLGRADEARQMRHETFVRRNAFFATMLPVTGENAREGYIRLHAPELSAYVDLLTRFDPAEAGRGVMEVSLNRKGLLLKVASEIQQVARLAKAPEMTKIAEELTATRKELAAITLAGPTEKTRDTHLATIARLNDRISELQGDLGRASVRYRKAAAPVSVDDLVAALPDDSVVIDFLGYTAADGGRRLVAAAMVKDGGKATFSLVKYPDPAAVDAAVLKYRKDIQDEDLDFDEVLDSGVETYKAIWAPLTPVIGNHKKVVVIPDGALNILPFAALAAPDGKFLIEKVDLHIYTTGRNLLPSAIPPARGAYMIDAGPDYDTDAVTGKEVLEKAKQRRGAVQDSLRGMASGLRGLRFDPLPGAQREGELIEKRVQGEGRKTVVHMKGDAQEKSLRGLDTPPEVLHIATHGFFLKPDDTLRKRLLKLQRSADVHIPPPGDNPLLRAGLAFAGINANAPLLGEIDTDNDGVLTALEVLGLDLSGTRLAILSACETGLGEIHEGEGVYGLRRAFQEAGVGSVVTSLWEVSDAGTQTLMTNLYGRLMAGKAPHQALRETQLQMLGDPQWSAPYIWSAFFMVDG